MKKEFEHDPYHKGLKGVCGLSMRYQGIEQDAYNFMSLFKELETFGYFAKKIRLHQNIPHHF